MARTVQGGSAIPVAITAREVSGIETGDGAIDGADLIVLIMRDAKEDSVVMEAAHALSDTGFDMRNYERGEVVIPATWSDANLGFKVAEDINGTYDILRDKTGVPVQISGIVVGAASVYALPEEVFGSHFVKLWSKHKTAGTVTDVNQAENMFLKLHLKG